VLYVHPDTVSLHLERIEELLGMPLTRPETHLQAKAALMNEDVNGHAWQQYPELQG
jgi:DNA-binding PucR family transcriptional regulator